MDELLRLTLGDVAIALVFVAAVAALSAVYRLALEKQLLIGTARTFIQLLAVGYALKWIFGLERWYLVLAAVAAMVLAAGWHGAARVEGPRARRVLISTASVFFAAAAVVVVLFGLVVRVQPWYNARYFIPLASMIIMAAMNGSSLGMATFATAARDNAERLEAALAAGAPAAVAARPYVRDAAKKAMIPSVNALMAVGIVHLPGAMTGMILAGAPPTAAVFYQMVVMYMITAAAALSAFAGVLWYSRGFFTPAQQLREEYTQR